MRRSPAACHRQRPEMRLELQEVGKVTLLNDAYNANPFP